jgi:hypothetical protein
MIRSSLIALSHSRAARRFVLSNSLARRTARRFVAGEELDDALAAARASAAARIARTLRRAFARVATLLRRSEFD